MQGTWTNCVERKTKFFDVRRATFPVNHGLNNFSNTIIFEKFKYNSSNIIVLY